MYVFYLVGDWRAGKRSTQVAISILQRQWDIRHLFMHGNPYLTQEHDVRDKTTWLKLA